MQRIILFCGVLVASFKYGRAQYDGVNLYSKRYERLDIDTILLSPRLVTNYVECLLNRKPCPPEGKDLKRILPEALRTKCGRCWPSQKEGAIKVITKLYYDYPDHYNALRSKWDPTGEYHRRFMEYLKDNQFNVITDNVNEIIGDQSQITISASQGNEISPVNRPGSSNPKPIPLPKPQQQPQPRPPPTSRPQIQTTTTSRVTTTVPANITQRPTRQDGNPAYPSEIDPAFAIGTRFGDDANQIISNPPTKRVPAPPNAHSSTPAPPSTTLRFESYDPTYLTTMTTFQTRNPILNLINRLSWKFTNTADFIAGMIRHKVKVITGVNWDNRGPTHFY